MNPESPSHSAMSDILAGSRFVKIAGPAGDWIVFHAAPPDFSLTEDEVKLLCDRRHGVGAIGTVAMSPADETTDHAAAQHHLTAWDANGAIINDMTEPARAATSAMAALEMIDNHNTSHHAFQTTTTLVTTVYTPAYIGVDIGQWCYAYPETAMKTGSDALVMTAGLHDPRPGLSIRLHSDHIILAVESHQELQAIDLSQEPSIEPTPQGPTTVGFVVPQDPVIDSGMGQLEMRSSGETGDHTVTNAAAAASVAFQQWSGLEQLNVWNVQTPTGVVVVQLHDDNRISTFAPAWTVFFGRF